MHGSKSDYYGFRKPTFSFGNRGTEHLGTIREDVSESVRLIDNYDGMKLCRPPPVVANSSPPKKSPTFHGLYDLRKESRRCKVQNRSTHIVTTFIPSSSAATAPTSSTTTSTSSEYKQKHKCAPSHTDPPISPSSSCSTLTIPRKRSIFYEMGERIRLFSTASFVSPATTSSGRCSEPGGASTTVTTTGAHGTTVIGLAKSHSLNSFEEPAPLYVSTTRCPSSGRKTRAEQQQQQQQKGSRIDAIGSLLSLPGHEESGNFIGMMEADLEKGLEKDVSQLGILCHHCSTTDLTCPRTTQKELPSPSASSVYSLARSDMSNEPLCRICHCCWPPDSNDPLISPCRCSGSLQYVHVSCLMHWLDISSRKLHRPAICELCLYKYRRRRVLKYREMKLPQCAQADIRYYTLFVVAILLMILSAFATVVCFQLEKTYGLQADRGNRTLSPLNVEGVVSDLGPSAPSPPSIKEVPEETTPMVVLGARKRIGDITVSASSKDEYRRDEAENILSTVTLIAAMVFFLSFFLAMYAHVKSGLSFCGYLTLCWSSNLEWSIEEYKHSRDTQYLNKLEELRRKINEKQKKAADEVEPLRSSVIVLE